MENEKYYEEAFNKINNKQMDLTIKLADSILALVSDTLTNANEKKGKINSVKKYKNLGSLSKKESSLIEKSSYVIDENGITIKLDYSKLLPKYNIENEKNLIDNGNGGKFDDENIDYELLNRILSKYNIEVKKEENKITTPKYCNVYKKILTITLRKKEQEKKESITDADVKEYILKVKQTVIKTISILMTLFDFDKDLFTELFGELDGEDKEYTTEESINKLKKYVKSIASFLTNFSETEDEKFTRIFGQTKEEYMNSKKATQSKVSETIEKIKETVLPIVEEVGKESTEDKDVCTAATEIYEKVKEKAKPILETIEQNLNNTGKDEERDRVKSVLLNFFRETSDSDVKSTIDSILNRMQKK